MRIVGVQVTNYNLITRLNEPLAHGETHNAQTDKPHLHASTSLEFLENKRLI